MEVYAMALEAITNTAVMYQEANKIEKKQTKEGKAGAITITEVSDHTPVGEHDTTKTVSQGGQAVKSTEKQIKDTIDQANNKLKQIRTNCQFIYHEPTKTVQIKVIDQDSKEVLKEIPSDQTLKTIEKIWEIAGIMMDEKF